MHGFTYSKINFFVKNLYKILESINLLPQFTNYKKDFYFKNKRQTENFSFNAFEKDKFPCLLLRHLPINLTYHVI